MTEMVIALLMIVNGEIKEHRIQESMSHCLKGKRIAMRESKDHIAAINKEAKEIQLSKNLKKEVETGKNGTQKYVLKQGVNRGKTV